VRKAWRQGRPRALCGADAGAQQRRGRRATLRPPWRRCGCSVFGCRGSSLYSGGRRI